MSWFKRNLWPQVKFIGLMCLIAVAVGASR